MHGATSMGRVDMGIDWRKMPTTIYERLAGHKLDSVIYYHDSTMASTFDGLAGRRTFSALSLTIFLRLAMTMIFPRIVSSSHALRILRVAMVSRPFPPATSIPITM